MASRTGLLPSARSSSASSSGAAVKGRRSMPVFPAGPSRPTIKYDVRVKEVIELFFLLVFKLCLYDCLI